MSFLKLDPRTSSDWRQIILTSKTASTDAKGKAVPLNSAIFPQLLNARAIAVQVRAGNSRPHWTAGGWIGRHYSYPGKPVTDSNFFLKLDEINLIKFDDEQTGKYRLIYYPRNYFTSYRLTVWQYIGQQSNPTDEQLQEIKAAISTIDLSEQLAVIQASIDEKVASLSTDNTEIIVELTKLKTELLREINELDAGIFTIAEGIGYLLPAEQASNLRRTAQQRLNLSLGFL